MDAGKFIATTYKSGLVAKAGSCLWFSKLLVTGAGRSQAGSDAMAMHSTYAVPGKNLSPNFPTKARQHRHSQEQPRSRIAKCLAMALALALLQDL
ncbi:hypothetical protein VTN77DRAFT_9120 [Rasamsonia byssochlamydoides]|uniref:uncharacterized protein n=1 Tax=Rasamsonia byssochlamydoides TaxID=89139 RepID=UPI003743E851